MPNQMLSQARHFNDLSRQRLIVDLINHSTEPLFTGHRLHLPRALERLDEQSDRRASSSLRWWTVFDPKRRGPYLCRSLHRLAQDGAGEFGLGRGSGAPVTVTATVARCGFLLKSGMPAHDQRSWRSRPCVRSSWCGSKRTSLPAEQVAWS